MSRKPVLVVILLVVIFICVGLFLVKMFKDTKTPIINNSKNVSEQISISEIGNHSTSTDCWIAIEGGVYDVTDFIPDHPGGDQILQGCGKDATGMFNSRPNDGTSHSGSARSILSKYKIGDLAK